MRHIKKTFIPMLTMLITLGVLLCSLDISYAAESFWWMKEIPPPGPNQIINPAYLEKRDQLSQYMRQMNRQTNAANQGNRWTRRARAKSADRYRGANDTARLKNELKKIPMYLTVTPESGSAQAAAGAAQNPTPVAKLIINTILFDLNSSVLRPEDAVVLQEAAGELKQNPYNAVVIEGYTCDLGTKEYNLWLSKRRANSARSFLINQGVDAERLTAKGVGEANPVADNTTESGRERNRRVEFKVMQ